MMTNSYKKHSLILVQNFTLFVTKLENGPTRQTRKLLNSERMS